MNRPQRSPEAYRRWAEITDGPLLGLAVLFLVVLLVPLYQGRLAGGERTALRTMNVILWVAFGVDYAVRLWLAPDRRTHVRTHIADLLTLAVPFLRPLRLLRVVGLLGTATRRAGERQLLQTSSYVVTGIGVLIVVGAGLVLDAERRAPGGNIASAGDALWWAATTVTTVGYGDKYPVTTEGRFVAVGLMLGGIALLGVVTATVAAWFVRRFSTLQEQEQSVHEEQPMLLAQLEQLNVRLARVEALLERRAT